MRLVMRERLTSLLAVVIAGVVLIILSFSYQSNRALLALKFGLLAAITFIGTVMDHHCKNAIRITLHAISVFAIVLCVVGCMVTEEKFSLDIYALIFGIYGIAKGIIKTVETSFKFAEKNKMAWLFLADSIFEIVIGILMCIEMSEAIRVHLILIGGDAVYEGAIKFINEFVEQKIGIQQDA